MQLPIKLVLIVRSWLIVIAVILQCGIQNFLHLLIFIPRALLDTMNNALNRWNNEQCIKISETIHYEQLDLPACQMMYDVPMTYHNFSCWNVCAAFCNKVFLVCLIKAVYGAGCIRCSLELCLLQGVGQEIVHV